MGVSGALCRALVFAAAGGAGSRSALVVEVSPQLGEAADGLALCAGLRGGASDEPWARLAPGNGWQLLRVEEGGSQFEAATLSSTPAAFLSGAASAQGIAPLEGGTLYDLLATDAHYAGSYASQRYDDLREDGGGSDLRQFFAAAGADDAFGGASAARLAAGYAEEPGSATEAAHAAEGNCVLVTGPWKAGTRYSLTFTSEGDLVAAMGGPDVQPSMWYAPVAYAEDGAGGLRLTVRGDKRGVVCDAGRGTAQEADPAQELPLLSLGAPAACPVGEARAALRYGGECVACEAVAGTVAGDGGSCTCDTGTIASPVGGAACAGEWLAGSGESVASASTLAAALCARLAQELAGIAGGERSDAVAAAGGALAALLDDGAPLGIDEATITAATAAVVAERRPDPRARGDSLRAGGGLAADGTFVDARTGDVASFVDTRFGAGYDFDVAGRALEAAGFPCAALGAAQIDAAVDIGGGLCDA